MGNHNLDEFDVQMDEQAAKSKYFVALDIADILERVGLSQYQQQRTSWKLYGHICDMMIKLVVDLMVCFLIFNNCFILHFIYKTLFFLFVYALCLHLWFINIFFYVHFFFITTKLYPNTNLIFSYVLLHSYQPLFDYSLNKFYACYYT